ncbi:MAG TPA: glycosyltransferase family 2 protein [Blastocatellia bacterium]|nr:glycosyltransferase family 2 protein [Blastocatellia bacterium]
MARILFWTSVLAVSYAYVGYPLIVWMLARLTPRRVSKAGITPTVSVVIACHDEARNIEDRIKNLTASDYPKDRLEVIIVSDGSTDETVELARRNASDRVRVFAYPDQRGKAEALNLGVHAADGDIVVFADARQRFEPNAIKELVANFSDQSVGAVSGELVFRGGEDSSVREGVGAYWRYEKWIRKNESRCGSVIGATGAIYAIRRELWMPLPSATILDDVFTPMQIALAGRRVVFEDKAVAYDSVAETAGHEFSRKVRTLAGNYQLCQLMPRLLVPTRALVFQFYSHKLMRLAAPLFLLLLLAANVALAASGIEGGMSYFYRAALACQLVFYFSATVGGYVLNLDRRVRLLNVAYVFSVMNAAALVSLIYVVFGKRNLWARSE